MAKWFSLLSPNAGAANSNLAHVAVKILSARETMQNHMVKIHVFPKKTSRAPNIIAAKLGNKLGHPG